MRNIFVITSRELFSYFGSSLGYILAAIFVAISAGLTFYFGHFFDRGVADLSAFFQYHPVAASSTNASFRYETMGGRN